MNACLPRITPVKALCAMSSAKASPKDFLDTSVVIPLFFGTRAARRSYKEGLPGKRYVSNYVSLEFHGACLRRLIDVYFLIDMPNIETVTDALRLAAQHFAARQLKMDIQAALLLGGMASSRSLSMDEPDDKAPLQLAFGEYILRLASLFKRAFTNIGTDSARCKRCLAQLKPDFKDQQVALKAFADEYDDHLRHRKACGIAKFFLRKHKDQVEALCAAAPTSKPKSKHKAFIGMCEGLQAILDENGGPHSCLKCSKLGDIIIALDVPSDMSIAHLDNSFNDICPILGKQHRQFPSVSAATKTP